MKFSSFTRVQPNEFKEFAYKTVAYVISGSVC